MLTLTTPTRTLDPFESLLQGFLRRSDSSTGDPTATPAVVNGWSPTTDVFADAEGYRFRFDLPGVAKENIHIEIEDNVLTVSGERKNEVEENKEGRLWRRETRYGSFKRAFQLPTDADSSNIGAAYRDGVLELRVPKSPEVKARKIEIEA